MYNHLEGSSYLTQKDRLHESLKYQGHQYYPQTFSVPLEWEKLLVYAERKMVLGLLRKIGKDIEKILGNLW